MEANILLVEDDTEIARIIRDTLITAGHKVTWATTGLEGLNDFQSGSYDLMLVDLMLPEMDGFALCRNVRWKSDIPIIIISARKDDVDKIEGLGLGADDYMSKPFSLAELKARIDSHLRRWFRYNRIEEERHELLYDRGLTINYSLQCVFLFGEELPLTNKEFELLCLLAENGNRIFSKHEIYEHVWQQADIEGLHTVTVHIKSLREKLKDPVKSPHFIQTIWGKGYRFIGVPS
ncbi:response regulator transcription factor [Cytobacillus solani]|uniref:Regulator n=1 Tax=Cytobacillus solani TaxID=1637975 RepID=A0A0Q3TXG8_9BACI|nr:response regulator transcription factor [Cytobacillus solani]KOP78843.1 regulator [Bacillus sp. FJAT-21945]KQL27605.1 regulator [Cytobacillus solani]USK55317.1 response regulator transcription factor [Cytobacillus solani]